MPNYSEIMAPHIGDADLVFGYFFTQGHKRDSGGGEGYFGRPARYVRMPTFQALDLMMAQGLAPNLATINILLSRVICLWNHQEAIAMYSMLKWMRIMFGTCFCYIG